MPRGGRRMICAEAGGGHARAHFPSVRGRALWRSGRMRARAGCARGGTHIVVVAGP